MYINVKQSNNQYIKHQFKQKQQAFITLTNAFVFVMILIL